MKKIKKPFRVHASNDADSHIDYLKNLRLYNEQQEKLNKSKIKMKVVESKYLRFEEVVKPNRKTKSFEIFSKVNNSFLGRINWYGAWRKYVFEAPHDQIILDVVCMGDICNFIKELMNERKIVKIQDNRNRPNGDPDLDLID